MLSVNGKNIYIIIALIFLALLGFVYFRQSNNTPIEATVSRDFNDVKPAVTDNGFIYSINDSYHHARDILKQNEWLPIIPSTYETGSGKISTSTPIDSEFPEISYCGSGVDAICTVDFKKGSDVNHLNLQHGELNEGWFVVGSE